MISCIICSRDKDLLAATKQSIGQTIGVEYEIVAINNREENLPICKAYNKGAAIAKFNHLVFVHEDVIFQTKNWGTVLLNHFNSQKDTGCIGVAGGTYKTKAPSHWINFVRGYEYLDISYLIQHYKNGNQELRDSWIDKSKTFQEVTLLDGVFIAIDKRNGIVFDEGLKGFHCYDLAVSLDAIKKGYRNFVTHEILIEHLSAGSFNSDWIKAIHQFHLDNASLFPLSVTGITVDQKDLEKKRWQNLLNFPW